MLKSTLAALSLAAAASAQAACDPLQSTCPAAPGLPTPTYSIDFTQQTGTPTNWTLASYETVTYSPTLGAEFTFAKRYDAPYIWTDFYFLFGTVEIVAQAAPGQGIISSLVLISEDLDEIDWEFSGTQFGSSSAGLIQTNYFGKGITGAYDRGTQVPTTFSPQSGFHTYTLDWTPTQLTWAIDGTVVRTLGNSGATAGDYLYPQSPMQVHLGLWDAGDADTAAGTVQWAGGYTDLSDVPFSSYVKSVSISTPNPCASYSYADMSGSASSIMCGNQSAVAGAAPQQVNVDQVLGGGSATTTTADASAATMTANGTVYVTVMDPDCTCMKTYASALPTATLVPANGTAPYTVPAATMGSLTPATYTGAAGRLTPFGGVIGVLLFFF